MNNDMIFILVIAAFIGYYMCKKEGFFEGFLGNITENFAVIDDARQAVKEIYTADIEAIRNLSEVSKRLQAGGLTMPGTLTVNSGGSHLPIIAQSNTDSHILLRTQNNGNKDSYLINRDGHFRMHMANEGDIMGVDHNGHMWNVHNGDHVAHHIGKGANPYITLSRSGQWGNSSWYLQNVHNDHPNNSTFRIGKHDVGAKLDIGSDGYLNASGVRLGGNADVSGDIVATGGNNWIFHTPDDNRRTMYIAPSKAYGNRDWNWGASTELNPDGSVVIKGNLTVGGRNILAELDAIKSGYIPYGKNSHLRLATGHLVAERDGRIIRQDRPWEAWGQFRFDKI